MVDRTTGQRGEYVHCECRGNDGGLLDPVYLLNALGTSWVLLEVDEGIFKALLENVPLVSVGVGIGGAEGDDAQHGGGAPGVVGGATEDS